PVRLPGLAGTVRGAAGWACRGRWNACCSWGSANPCRTGKHRRIPHRRRRRAKVIFEAEPKRRGRSGWPWASDTAGTSRIHLRVREAVDRVRVVPEDPEGPEAWCCGRPGGQPLHDLIAVADTGRVAVLGDAPDPLDRRSVATSRSTTSM